MANFYEGSGCWLNLANTAANRKDVLRLFGLKGVSTAGIWPGRWQRLPCSRANIFVESGGCRLKLKEGNDFALAVMPFHHSKDGIVVHLAGDWGLLGDYLWDKAEAKGEFLS